MTPCSEYFAVAVTAQVTWNHGGGNSECAPDLASMAAVLGVSQNATPLLVGIFKGKPKANQP